MICQRIVLCDHRKQYCVCHSVWYIKESTYRMAHCMYISKPCKGKSNSGKKRTGQHCLSCLQICTTCNKPADIFTDQFHRFLSHGIRKRRGCCRNICLFCMNKCIDSTCCRHRCRCRCQKFRIQYRIRRKKFITEYRQFIISAVICDNRKRSDL